MTQHILKKKVCMLGAFSVGKTSLVRQVVTTVFTDKYLTTVGVKVDKKHVSLETVDVDMLIWDIYGEDNLQSISLSYLRGASGYLLVLDGTRKETLTIAKEIEEKVERTIGPMPSVVMLNKSDIEDRWEITDDAMAQTNAWGWRVFRTSAKTGEGVEEAFKALAMSLC
ncbi:MAG: GTP-binding protein [Verrucomicrobia bacterium]|nr:GTP-binding protein [Verrucomicrobiota bacterium]